METRESKVDLPTFGKPTRPTSAITFNSSCTQSSCAAVSVLTVNMANSVEKFTDDGFKGSVDEKTGQFIFHFTGTVSAESKLLMDSLILGLTDIAESYGDKYIKIRFREV